MMLSLVLLSMALLAGMIVQYFTNHMRRMERSNGH